MELADTTKQAITRMVDWVGFTDPVEKQEAVELMSMVARMLVRAGADEASMPDVLSFASNLADRGLTEDEMVDAALEFRQKYQAEHPKLFPAQTVFDSMIDRRLQ